METRHYPPAGQTILVGHTGADCACNPRVVKIRKSGTSGRGGSHQGYKIARVEIHHN